MSPLTEPLSRPALPQVEGAGDFSVREYEQVAGAITESGTTNGRSTRVTMPRCHDGPSFTVGDRTDGAAALIVDSPWTSNQGGWRVHDGLELDQRN